MGILNLCIPNISALWVILNPIRLMLHILFLPTMQGYFLTLSIARTHDLSWGNRAGIGQEESHLRSKSHRMMVVQVMCNTALVVLFLSLFVTNKELHGKFL